MRLTTVALAVSVALSFMSPALAQEDWKLASAKRAPDVGAQFDQEVADVVNENAGGAGKVEVQFVGNEQEMVQQVLRGRLQFGATSPLGLSAVIPEMAIFNMPYLWASRAERDFVYTNHLVEPLKKMFESKGLVLLSIQDAGYNGVFCKLDCSVPTSLKGQKVRVSPSAASKMFYESLSAIPVQLPLADVWPALEQNLVVAGDLPLGFFSSTPGAATARHFVFTQHTHSAWLYFANKRVWDALNPEVQKATLAAMPAPLVTSDRLMAYQDEAAKSYTGKGGTVYPLTDDERAEWAALIVPNIPAFVSTLSPGAQELYKTIEAAKAEFATKNK